MTYSIGRAALTAALVSACGSSAAMPPATAETQSRISAAEAVGAQREPAAALHLKLARDQLAAARQEARDGDEEEARLLVDRADVDAELALVLTREAEARDRAQQAEQRVDQLRTQTK